MKSETAYSYNANLKNIIVIQMKKNNKNSFQNDSSDMKRVVDLRVNFTYCL